MFIYFVFLFVLLSVLFLVVTYKKNIIWWLPSYIMGVLSRPTVKGKPVHIMFCFVDHFEPAWRTKDIEVERQRVDRWHDGYPKMADGHKDADGCFPKHTFFYPEEEYREEHLSKISDLCERGYGEVEIHLHHHDDTETNFRDTINSFKDTLNDKHGMLSKDSAGDIKYVFIHGNWALDNSDPTGNNCGINNELILLNETGCIGDMTYPSAPHPTQPSKVNSIYMAVDDAHKPKSFNSGIDVQVGVDMVGDTLMVEGPLGFDFYNAKWGLMPRIENGDIRKTQPPTNHRVDNWVNRHIHVKGREDWVFIKIHTHGTQDSDMDTLLCDKMSDMHDYLESKYNDGENYVLHYVSAREMINIVHAARDGKDENPNLYRDYKYTISY